MKKFNDPTLEIYTLSDTDIVTDSNDLIDPDTSNPDTPIIPLF